MKIKEANANGRLSAFLGMAALMLLPQCAWADTITPMMAASGLYLLFGNLVIGVGEGLLLAGILGGSRRECMIVMVSANFISAWAGYLLLNGVVIDSISIDITNARAWFWILVAIAYLLTVLIEWPFIAWLMDRSGKWFGRSVKLSFLVQGASYVVLLVLYSLAMMGSHRDSMEVVKLGAFALPPSVSIYYIAPDGDVYKRPLSGGDARKIASIHSRSLEDRVFMAPNAQFPTAWDLSARVETPNPKEPRIIGVLTNLSLTTIDNRRPSGTEGMPDGNSRQFGRAQCLGSATNSDLRISTLGYAAGGLSCSSERGKFSSHFMMEAFLRAWEFRNVVLLPDEQLLFQLGEDQICILDLPTRRIALLCHGRGPVPVIERP